MAHNKNYIIKYYEALPHRKIIGVCLQSLASLSPSALTTAGKWPEFGPEGLKMEKYYTFLPKLL
jgi:hypothetical protein